MKKGPNPVSHLKLISSPPLPSAPPAHLAKGFRKDPERPAQVIAALRAIRQNLARKYRKDD